MITEMLPLWRRDTSCHDKIVRIVIFAADRWFLFFNTMFPYFLTNMTDTITDLYSESHEQISENGRLLGI